MDVEFEERHLAPSQRQLLQSARQRWLSDDLPVGAGLSEPEGVRAVEAIYRVAGLLRPHVVNVLDSPLATQQAAVRGGMPRSWHDRWSDEWNSLRALRAFDDGYWPTDPFAVGVNTLRQELCLQIEARVPEALHRYITQEFAAGHWCPQTRTEGWYFVGPAVLGCGCDRSERAIDTIARLWHEATVCVAIDLRCGFDNRVLVDWSVDDPWLRRREAAVIDFYVQAGVLTDAHVKDYVEFLASGIFVGAFAPGYAIVSRRPLIVLADGDGRLHADSGAAITFADGYAVPVVHGVLQERRDPGEPTDAPSHPDAG